MVSYDVKTINDDLEAKQTKLIREISDKISDEILDSVPDELENKLEGFAESVDTASEKVNSISESLEKLNAVVDTLQGFDFAKELRDLASTQQAVTQSVAKAQTVFDDCSQKNKSFLGILQGVCKELCSLQKGLSEVVMQIRNANSQLISDAEGMKNQAEHFNALMEPANEAVEAFKQQTQELKESDLSERMRSLEEKTGKLQSQLENLQKEIVEQRKPSRITIGILAVGVVVIILQIVSFFI